MHTTEWVGWQKSKHMDDSMLYQLVYPSFKLGEIHTGHKMKTQESNYSRENEDKMHLVLIY